MSLTLSFISLTSPTILPSGIVSPSLYKVPKDASCFISRAVGFTLETIFIFFLYVE